jgi:hypothetical protein
MKKMFLGLVIFGVMLFSLAADVIPPGSRAIPVTSRISNFSDFPEHVFLSAQTGFDEMGMSFSMCPVYLVSEEGEINPGYYKLCPLSVYAVRRDRIDPAVFDPKGKFKAEELGWSLEQTAEYMRSLEPAEVIRGIRISLTVPFSSPKKAEMHNYTVEFGAVKEVPDDIKSEKNVLTSLYYILPIPALLLLGFITYRRLRRKP